MYTIISTTVLSPILLFCGTCGVYLYFLSTPNDDDDEGDGGCCRVCGTCGVYLLSTYTVGHRRLQLAWKPLVTLVAYSLPGSL